MSTKEDYFKKNVGEDKLNKAKEAGEKAKEFILKGIEEGGNVEDLIKELQDQHTKGWGCVGPCGLMCAATCVVDGPLPLLDPVAGAGAMGTIGSGMP